MTSAGVAKWPSPPWTPEPTCWTAARGSSPHWPSNRARRQPPMRIPLIRLFILTLTLVACTAVAYAQVQPADVTPTSTVTFDWKTVLATFLNTTLVVAVVAGINAFRPVIREQYPWAVPLMATIL